MQLENMQAPNEMSSGRPAGSLACALIACLFICICSSLGCTQLSVPRASAKTYRPARLPAHFAAKPIQDYSQLDLTPYAKAQIAENLIRPGDRLAVHLNTGTWGEEAEQTWQVGVDDAGNAQLPHIGPVQLAGMTRAEAEQTVIQASLTRQVFLTPTVDIAADERSEQSVTVMGAVNQPGVVPIAGGETTLADVIVRAGGFSNVSSGRVIVSGGRVSRPASGTGMTGGVTPIGHSQIAAQTVSLAESPPAALAKVIVPEGAVVSVEPEPQRGITVLGVIRNKSVDIPPGKNMRLLDALTLAGGPSYSNWILDRVDVIRKSPDGQTTVRIKCSIRRAKNDARENILLSSNDVVSVEENILTFTLSTVQSLFAVGTSGMRLAVP